MFSCEIYEGFWPISLYLYIANSVFLLLYIHIQNIIYLTFKYITYSFLSGIWFCILVTICAATPPICRTEILHVVAADFYCRNISQFVCLMFHRLDRRTAGIQQIKPWAADWMDEGAEKGGGPSSVLTAVLKSTFCLITTLRHKSILRAL